MRTSLGTIRNAEIFMDETARIGVYSPGDRITVRNRVTGTERELTPQQARQFFNRVGIQLVPGEHLDHLSRQIQNARNGNIQPASEQNISRSTHQSLYQWSLAQADRYLNVGNYQNVVRNLGLAVVHARLAGIEPDRVRVSDIWSRGIANLSEMRAGLDERRAGSGTEGAHNRMRVDRWMESYARFGDVLDRMLHSAVSVVYWRDELGLNLRRAG